MAIRRVLYYWLFIGAVLLPAWVLIARGVFGSSVDWDFLLFVILCPMLAVAMFIAAGLTYARKSVRMERAVSWADAAVIGAWHAAIILYGFVDSTLVAALIVIGAIAAFWIAAWQLYTETRRRVRGALANLEHNLEQASRQPGTGPGTSAGNGRVIILEPGETRHPR